MPLHYLPRNRGVHRVAAIALFRALLRTSDTVPVTASDREKVQNVIRNIFRRHAYVSSVRLLTDAFKAGYSQLEDLQKATSDHDASKIADYLANVRPTLTLPQPSHARYATTHNLREAERKAKVEAAKPPVSTTPRPSIFERFPRPQSELQGRPRKVPILTAAGRVPFLRITKPQPEVLSNYLRNRQDQFRKRQDQMEQLELSVYLARFEDEWEDRMARLDSASGTSTSRALVRTAPTEDKWVYEAVRAHGHVRWTNTLALRKAARLSKAMQALVDREQTLADQEAAQRREVAAQKKAAKRGEQRAQRAGGS